MSEKGLFWEMIEGKIERPPVLDLLGWKLLEADKEKGRIRVQFEAKEAFLNLAGNIQGGLLAAMLDSTLSPALMFTLGPGQFAPTLELKTSFIRPAKVGLLIGEGRVMSAGKTICFLEGELADTKGNLIAKASATAMVVNNLGPGLDK